MQAAQKPKLWTRNEYDRMVEVGVLGPSDKVELIFGEIRGMSPQKGPHFTGIRKVQEALRVAFGSGYEIRAQGPLALCEDSEPEPDVAVVLGGFEDYRDAHPETALLVVEIADTTLSFDRGAKKHLYAQARIPEYWIVNLKDRELEVFREPGDGEYRLHQRLIGSATVAPLAAPHTRLMVSDLLP